MTESILAMAKDLALAQIKAGQVPPEEMTAVLNATYETLKQLSENEQTDSSAPVSIRPTSWKKSITKHAVTCMECGATFRQLAKRHLQSHDLDGRTYRQKYGIPRTQSLSAKDVQAKRIAIVNRVKPWEKSPNNQKAQPKASAKTKPTPSKKAPKKMPKRAAKKATAKRP